MSEMNRWIGRRELLKLAGVGGVGLATTAAGITWPIQPAIAQQNSETVSPDIALKRLLDGNKRFVEQKREYPDQSQKRVQEIANVQHPFATILSCADSRVSPEIIFDLGLGDLFDIRVAGNILDDSVLGSVEYAAKELNVPLLMVLGHERCGAVTATLKGGEVPGHISSLVKAIQPAVKKVKSQPGDLLDNAVRENVKMVVEQLKSSQPIMSDLIKSGQVKIVGGRYDLDSGAVEIIA